VKAKRPSARTPVVVHAPLATLVGTIDLGAVDELVGLFGEDESDFDSVSFLLPAGAAVPRLSINSVVKLSDGTQIVRTVHAGSDAMDRVRADLFKYDDNEAWRTTFTDKRGVFAFRDALVDEIEELPTHAAAVKHLGKRGQWLLPQRQTKTRTTR
jgi:hypothetical protein